jgi:hypothetical protein
LSLKNLFCCIEKMYNNAGQQFLSLAMSQLHALSLLQINGSNQRWIHSVYGTWKTLAKILKKFGMEERKKKFLGKQFAYFSCCNLFYGWTACIWNWKHRFPQLLFERRIHASRLHIWRYKTSRSGIVILKKANFLLLS